MAHFERDTCKTVWTPRAGLESVADFQFCFVLPPTLPLVPALIVVAIRRALDKYCKSWDGLVGGFVFGA